MILNVFHIQILQEGALALSNPLEVVKSSKDIHHGLYPRPSKKLTSSHSISNSEISNVGDIQTNGAKRWTYLSGNQSNPDISKQNFNLGNTRNPATSSRPVGMSGSKFANRSKPYIPGQSTMLHFISSQPSPMKNKTENLSYSSQQINNNTSKSSWRSVMYSPIKKVADSNVIYVSDDSPSKSPMSENSQNETSTTCSAKELLENPVVKQLFASQKQLSKNPDAFKKKTKGKSFSKMLQTTSSSWNTANKLLVSIPSSDLTSDDDDDLFSAAEDVSKSVAYGLLGEENNLEDNKINYFDVLPEHIIENIFCQLPMLDLCLNCNRVCLKWNAIISSEKFVPWKKLYHKIKKNDADSRHKINSIMWNNGMPKTSAYLAGLIRYMKSFKPVTADNMIECLMKHPKYTWAMALINERLQECIQNGVVNPWCLITTLVIISETVEDIQKIIQCLSVSDSQCTSKEMLECLYCICSFLLAFKMSKGQDVWNGMHYRLFYAIYLHENASLTSCGDMKSVVSGNSGQQSLYKYSKQSTTMKLTHEQKRIIAHNPSPGEIIKIVAFAGTGKTTTLVRYTQLRPNMQFLLVVYNRSVCEYAKKIFPPNVTCKTGHGLAYRSTGLRYSQAGKLRNLKIPKVIDALPNRKGDSLFVRAKFVLDTLNTFLASDDSEIMGIHVPTEVMNEKNGQMVPLEEQKKQWYIKDAEFLWNRMVDLQDKKVPMTFDGYLKLYQLSKPKLKYYDMLLIDEAQDLTPAITDILLSQQQAKILVGDPHQQIYSFRGAVNAMQQIYASTTFYLTQSFRFGPEIAQVAACCLETLKDEKQKTLVGNGKASTVQGEQVGQLAIITRTNFTLFNEAVKKCCYDNTDHKVAFVGGTEGFGFATLQDIYTLMMPEEQRLKEKRVIRDEFIKKFPNLAELEKYATKVNDAELCGKIKIVRTYHHNLPTCINKILSKTTGDQKTAGEQNKDEGNLLYVAVTRAKHALQMTPTIKSILSSSGGDGTVLPGGLYSPDYLTTNDSSFNELLGVLEEKQEGDKEKGMAS
ncbi:hypothetical protein KUTeg_021385 [Tegillarca granosa]|uniref:F-box domain-containing protein n=1 Tax=Tegillarca granosa TaxID=220873 RepID=A0ABQ9EGM3_TEGGR|nr:hypothetical protein KUTeg_021385 [Tegillarca granosa]